MHLFQYYACRGLNHIAQNCIHNPYYNFNINYIEENTYSEYNDNTSKANLVDYYSRNKYVDSWISNHFTREISNLLLIDIQTLNRAIKLVDIKLHRIKATYISTMSTRYGAVKIHNILYVYVLNYIMILIHLLRDNSKLIVFTNK